jgi:hypothetical protein
MKQILLAIEFPLDLRSEWEIRDHLARFVISKQQFIHKQTYYVRPKSKATQLKKLIGCDDMKMHRDRLQAEMNSLEEKQRQ